MSSCEYSHLPKSSGLPEGAKACIDFLDTPVTPIDIIETLKQINLRSSQKYQFSDEQISLDTCLLPPSTSIARAKNTLVRKWWMTKTKTEAIAFPTIEPCRLKKIPPQTPVLCPLFPNTWKSSTSLEKLNSDSTLYSGSSTLLLDTDNTTNLKSILKKQPTSNLDLVKLAKNLKKQGCDSEIFKAQLMNAWEMENPQRRRFTSANCSGPPTPLLADYETFSSDSEDDFIDLDLNRSFQVCFLWRVEQSIIVENDYKSKSHYYIKPITWTVLRPDSSVNKYTPVGPFIVKTRRPPQEMLRPQIQASTATLLIKELGIDEHLEHAKLKANALMERGAQVCQNARDIFSVAKAAAKTLLFF